ncbi:hypothetical protein PROFUN_05325 [Planoprotostelium fungivorum]|uniref:Uncharacterized protein n=1 Tax=Planoprotostelium fungivorum TaxID=1890364 RepID=A0A2P6NR31_9EUKA|nr:hypothetical protein PROFUN_05325 [Planoprotostelium fungivorum]
MSSWFASFRGVIPSSNFNTSKWSPLARWSVLSRLRHVSTTAVATAVAGALASTNPSHPEINIDIKVWILLGVTLCLSHSLQNLVHDWVCWKAVERPNIYGSQHPLSIATEQQFFHYIFLNALSVVCLVFILHLSGLALAYSLVPFFLAFLSLRTDNSISGNFLWSLVAVWEAAHIDNTFHLTAFVRCVPVILGAVADQIGETIDRTTFTRPPSDFASSLKIVPVQMQSGTSSPLKTRVTLLSMLGQYATVLYLSSIGSLPSYSCVVLLALFVPGNLKTLTMLLSAAPEKKSTHTVLSFKNVIPFDLLERTSFHNVSFSLLLLQVWHQIERKTNYMRGGSSLDERKNRTYCSCCSQWLPSGQHHPTPITVHHIIPVAGEDIQRTFEKTLVDALSPPPPIMMQSSLLTEHHDPSSPDPSSRFVWTKALDDLFLRALQEVETNRPTAMEVFQKMNDMAEGVDLLGLTRKKVSSRLQRHRKMVDELQEY